MISHFALITGASGGLGQALAEEFARRGYPLILSGRNVSALGRAAIDLHLRYGVRTEVAVADLEKPDGPQMLVRELALRGFTIDILVNNAGFGSYGKFHETSAGKEQEMIRVNVEALTALTKLLLPGMVERGSGKILNVASTAAFQPGPLMAVYYATKAYVLSFSLALSREVKNTGVTVTCLCPGPTATGFEHGAGLEKSRLFRLGTMDAATVARIGVRACMRGKPLVIAGWKNRIGAFCTRFVSRSFAAALVEHVQKPLDA